MASKDMDLDFIPDKVEVNLQMQEVQFPADVNRFQHPFRFTLNLSVKKNL